MFYIRAVYQAQVVKNPSRSCDTWLAQFLFKLVFQVIRSAVTLRYDIHHTSNSISVKTLNISWDPTSLHRFIHTYIHTYIRGKFQSNLQVLTCIKKSGTKKNRFCTVTRFIFKLLLQVIWRPNSVLEAMISTLKSIEITILSFTVNSNNCLNWELFPQSFSQILWLLV